MIKRKSLEMQLRDGLTVRTILLHQKKEISRLKRRVAILKAERDNFESLLNKKQSKLDGWRVFYEKYGDK